MVKEILDYFSSFSMTAQWSHNSLKKQSYSYCVLIITTFFIVHQCAEEIARLNKRVKKVLIVSSVTYLI